MLARGAALRRAARELRARGSGARPVSDRQRDRAAGAPDRLGARARAAAHRAADRRRAGARDRARERRSCRRRAAAARAPSPRRTRSPPTRRSPCRRRAPACASCSRCRCRRRTGGRKSSGVRCAERRCARSAARLRRAAQAAPSADGDRGRSVGPPSGRNGPDAGASWLHADRADDRRGDRRHPRRARDPQLPCASSSAARPPRRSSISRRSSTSEDAYFGEFNQSTSPHPPRRPGPRATNRRAWSGGGPSPVRPLGFLPIGSVLFTYACRHRCLERRLHGRRARRPRRQRRALRVRLRAPDRRRQRRPRLDARGALVQRERDLQPGRSPARDRRAVHRGRRHLALLARAPSLRTPSARTSARRTRRCRRASPRARGRTASRRRTAPPRWRSARR